MEIEVHCMMEMIQQHIIPACKTAGVGPVVSKTLHVRNYLLPVCLFHIVMRNNNVHILISFAFTHNNSCYHSLSLTIRTLTITTTLG